MAKRVAKHKRRPKGLSALVQCDDKQNAPAEPDLTHRDYEHRIEQSGEAIKVADTASGSVQIDSAGRYQIGFHMPVAHSLDCPCDAQIRSIFYYHQAIYKYA